MVRSVSFPWVSNDELTTFGTTAGQKTTNEGEKLVKRTDQKGGSKHGAHM